VHSELTRNEGTLVSMEWLNRGGASGTPENIQHLATLLHGPGLCVEVYPWGVLNARKMFFLYSPYMLHTFGIDEANSSRVGAIPHALEKLVNLQFYITNFPSPPTAMYGQLVGGNGCRYLLRCGSHTLEGLLKFTHLCRSQQCDVCIVPDKYTAAELGAESALQRMVFCC